MVMIVVGKLAFYVFNVFFVGEQVLLGFAETFFFDVVVLAICVVQLNRCLFVLFCDAVLSRTWPLVCSAWCGLFLVG